MEITLTPATQTLLDAQATALDEALLDAIDRAEDQIDRGEVHPLDDVRDRIRNRFLERWAGLSKTYRIIITAGALSELEEIADYIRQESPQNAATAATRCKKGKK